MDGERTAASVASGLGIVFALRQSPDWSALARDHGAGSNIDATRYVPLHRVLSFPDHISVCIAGWNASFGVDFTLG